MTNSKKRTLLSPAEIALALGISLFLAEYAIRRTGVTCVLTAQGNRVDALEFALRLDELLNCAEFSAELGLLNLRTLSALLCSPPELIAQAHEIEFPSSVTLEGVLFWPAETINRMFAACGGDWTTVLMLAQWASMTVPQISTMVINGDLPRVKTRNFVPGWQQDELADFVEGVDFGTVAEAGDYDIEHGRIYELWDAPEPLRAVDARALAQAYKLEVGHPLLLADGSYGWVAEHVDQLVYPPKNDDKSRHLTPEMLEGLIEE